MPCSRSATLAAEERAASRRRCAASGHTFDAAARPPAPVGGVAQRGRRRHNEAEPRLRHVESSPRSDRALVVLVAEDGSVENRLVDLPPGLPTSGLAEAANFLNAHSAAGRWRGQGRVEGAETERGELDQITARLVEAGLASWSGGDAKPAADRARASEPARGSQGARGPRAHPAAVRDLETQSDVIELLAAPRAAKACASLSARRTSCSRCRARRSSPRPPRRSGRIVGVIGVIGPTRLNYARIVPMVDYTAKVVSKIIGG